MKLKYYLRGIGIGVIVATLIMMVSSVLHNNNLSDEKIIKEALKLGMVMPESSDDKDSLWGSNTETESVTEYAQSPEDTQLSENSEAVQDSEDTQNAEDEQTSEDTQDSEEEEPAGVGVITIYDTDGARHVSEKLKAEGLIESAVDFRSYLSDNGYAKIIRSGTFEIPMGSTYEEICNIIIRK